LRYLREIAAEPLCTPLSQVLIAHTIEFDNAAEQRIPHRTTVGSAGDSARGPWLVSLAMWANFMAHLDQPRPLRELAEPARLTNLRGLQRWGYIKLSADPADPRPAPPRRDWVVAPTRWGALAREVWRPLGAEIETRWRDRFGAAALTDLREALETIEAGSGLELPDFLPVTGVRRDDPDRWRARPAAPADGAPLELYALLARVLLAYSIDYERESRLALGVSSNALRVLHPDGARVRDLPLAAGLSKEAIALSLGLLARSGCVVIEPDPATPRTRLARLTARGELAQSKHARLLAGVEAAWRERHGGRALERLRAALGGLLDATRDGGALLSQGLVPNPGGWRAAKPYLAQTEAMLADPHALAHFPMVSHRGGYPDGS
jgi:hypothetical protein